MKLPKIPTRCQLQDSPELAALTLLEVTLQTATRSLTAAHPTLGAAHDPDDTTVAPACIAHSLVILAGSLGQLITFYRGVCERATKRAHARERSMELPF